jgi:hypothetical protein
MRGDQLTRQWRVIRAIEASPNGLTLAEIAQREETGIRTIYRDLETLQAGGGSLYTERVDLANRWVFIDTFPSRTPPAFTLTEFMPFYFYKDLVRKALDQCLPLLQFPMSRGAVDLVRNCELYDLIPMTKVDFARPDPEALLVRNLDASKK